jgi:hypothetical protein
MTDLIARMRKYHREVTELDDGECEALAMVRNAADALEATVQQLENYEVLKRAVNESTNECGPNCDEYGHGDDCPSCNSARWLEDQQREIERLLRVEVKYTNLCNVLNEQTAEIERLRGLLTRCVAALEWAECKPDDYEADCPECQMRLLREECAAALGTATDPPPTSTPPRTD